VISRTLSDFFDELLAVDRSYRLLEYWQRARWVVMVMWRLMRVRTMVVVVMVCRMGN
jgi:hypothetical protein